MVPRDDKRWYQKMVGNGIQDDEDDDGARE